MIPSREYYCTIIVVLGIYLCPNWKNCPLFPGYHGLFDRIYPLEQWTNPLTMPKNLLIVESPAKAKTIEKFLGGDFTVKSSYGHIRDLDKKDLSVDVKSGFKPKYVITPDKQKLVKDLKDWVKKVDEVWLATDEDREGEAISWHLCHVLGLDERRTKRIVFHEITKPAIQKAIQTPRSLDLNLVNAQQARRVLDRLVGYELS